MAWMQKDQPEQLLMLASLLIGLKMGWPGSFQLFCYTLKPAKDVDIGLLPGAAFHALGSQQVAWGLEKAKFHDVDVVNSSLSPAR